MRPDTDHYLCHFDGSCEPINPKGNMGIGAIIESPDGKIVFQHSEYISAETLDFFTSNNIAEYIGITTVFTFLINNNLENEKIVVAGDSMLVIRQMAGEWSAKNGLYIPYYKIAKELSKKFLNIAYQWVPREHNTTADRLSKIAIIQSIANLPPNKHNSLI